MMWVLNIFFSIKMKQAMKIVFDLSMGLYVYHLIPEKVLLVTGFSKRGRSITPQSFNNKNSLIILNSHLLTDLIVDAPCRGMLIPVLVPKIHVAKD